ncbi:hypothetical protein N474_05700 [Pseudoalteromonas luteoviolacea CPMOR-2]|uniref:N-acetyltransferase domain-containing protein n=1 Tax=Pseudoalteromonas luteoviolacea DSM 6061 TaxID=1365250 RepID=A0A167AAC3_9GAMM|nr:GNAT family N-acetyltransferase [Pseudoalteromonas luteoviolacea]KZN45151.1 hypothetical protein N475_07805 [Pseudoalteromonas luteoviolacea DSM 6061]KZN60539.1 hypothetical protein N474_05700 [Pseudoalteromonas luteoviolacea CPMOR-2]MBE0386720.1 hypothetical protein [Pseudoalteromonas luteoviolacea DSM 6061]
MKTLFTTPRLDFFCCNELLLKPSNANFITRILTTNTATFLPDDWQTKPDSNEALHWLKERLIQSDIFVALPRNELSKTLQALRSPPLGLFIMHIEQDTAHIGYLIHEQFWHQGYGTELLAGSIDYLRDNTLVKTIYAGVDPNNVGSIRALEKCSFTQESLGNKDTNAFYKLQL